MPKFSYKAKEGPKQIVEGVIDAESQEVAIRKITQSGYTPIDVFPYEAKAAASSKGVKKAFSLFPKIKLKDTVSFTRQMCDLVGASVPILRSLHLVAKQTSNVYLKMTIEQMTQFVKDGGSFSGALGQQTQIFSNFYIELVRSGEASGQLAGILNRLADHMEKEYETKNKVISAMAYPALILGVGFLMMFVILSFVIPRISLMFDNFDQALPVPTRLVMGLSNVFASYWWLFALILIVGGVYFYQYSQSPSGRRQIDIFKLKLPFIGNFIRMVEVARLSRTMATLVEAGVPITTALNLVWSTMDNVVLQEEMMKVPSEIANGMSLHQALQRSTIFPEMASNMISVGEETGKLEEGFYKIAQTYERQSEEIMKTILTLLGPTVLIGIVVIVGFMLIAMLLPIIQMNLLVQ